MRVNLSAPPSSTAADPVANPTENSEGVSDGGFLAHMDQIWKKGASSASGNEEKPPRQDPVQGDIDPMTMRVAASMIPVPQQNCPLTVVDAVMPPGSAAADFQVPASSNAPDRSGLSAVMPDVPSSRMSVNTAEAVGGSEGQGLSGAIAPVPNPEARALSARFNPQDDQMKPQLPRRDGIISGANEDKTAAAKDPQPVQDIKTDAPGESVISEPAAAEPLPAVAAGRFEDPEEAHGVDAVVLPAKASNVAHAALENAGTNNSDSERKNFQSNFVSGIVQQNRSNEAQAPAEKPRFSDIELSVNIPASSMRASEIAVPSRNGRVEKQALRPDDFILQLSDRIQVQVREGRGEIRVQLHPENLGHLEITAEHTASGVAARIVAESSSVKNYLESNLNLLQQSLQDQGLKIDRIQVSVQDNGNSDSFAGSSTQTGHGSGRSGHGDEQDSGLGAFAGMNQPEELIVDYPTWLTLNPNSRFHTIA